MGAVEKTEVCPDCGKHPYVGSKCLTCSRIAAREAQRKHRAEVSRERDLPDAGEGSRLSKAALYRLSLQQLAYILENPGPAYLKVQVAKHVSLLFHKEFAGEMEDDESEFERMLEAAKSA